jgi:CHAD domain-containing protein
MAFRLRPDESVSRGLKRLARKELRSATGSLSSAKADRDEAVHDARRSVKKVRAILDILEEDGGRGLGKDRKRLRQISRSLSQLRDADVRVQTLDLLRRHAPNAVAPHTFALIRSKLLSDKQRLGQAPMRAAMATAVKMLGKSRRSAARWRSKHKNFRALSAAIRSARRQGRLAMNRARISQGAADFHEWRKWAKTLWYELRLFERAGPGVRADIRALRKIETWLGEDHNVVVLWERILGDPSFARGCGNLEKLRQASERYQDQLRRKALARGTKLYAAPPAAYAAYVTRSWRQWQRRANGTRQAR